MRIPILVNVCVILYFQHHNKVLISGHYNNQVTLKLLKVVKKSQKNHKKLAISLRRLSCIF